MGFFSLGQIGLQDYLPKIHKVMDPNYKFIINDIRDYGEDFELKQQTWSHI